MKQTAVEWFALELYEKFEMKGDGKVFDELLNQAKAMEKEQIKDALQEFLDITLPDEVCEKYYNETFKSE